MRISKPARILVSIAMSVVVSNAPAVASSAAADSGMIPTSTVVAQLSRAEAEAKVRDVLDQDSIRAALEKNGISSAEASKRLAAMSDADLRRLAGDIEQARAGGDILVAILLVVLIIYFAKRI